MRNINLSEVVEFLKHNLDLIINVVIGLGVLISIIVLASQTSFLHSLEKEVQRHSKMVTEMKEWKKKVKSRGGISSSGYLKRNQSLLSVLTPLARSLGLQSESIQPGTPVDRGTYILQSVKFKFKGVDFQALVKFIDKVESHESVKMVIKRASIERNVKGTGVNAVIEVEAYQEK